VSALQILPLYNAYRMIGDVATAATEEETEAWFQAEAAIDDAIQVIWPKRIEELAAQILIDTNMGDNGLSPGVLQRLKLIVDTAG